MTALLPLRRRATLAAATMALLATSLGAQAQLSARDPDGNSVADGYFDATLGITWLARADAAAGSAQDDGLSTSDGLLTWSAAQAWVAALSVHGASGWRLPTVDAACNGSGLGFGCSSAAGELGHHFHNNLGGTAGLPISSSHGPGFALFSGLGDAGQWSGQSAATDPDQAHVLLFSEGFQDTAFKDFSEHAAWAVHDGDVLAVPEPATVWTWLAGALALAWRARRSTRAD